MKPPVLEEAIAPREILTISLITATLTVGSVMVTLKAGPEDPARTDFKFHGCRHRVAAVGVQLEVCLCVAALGWASSIKLGIGTSSWHGGSAGESGCGPANLRRTLKLEIMMSLAST